MNALPPLYNHGGTQLWSQSRGVRRDTGLVGSCRVVAQGGSERIEQVEGVLEVAGGHRLRKLVAKRQRAPDMVERPFPKNLSSRFTCLAHEHKVAETRSCPRIRFGPCWRSEPAICTKAVSASAWTA